LLHLGAIKFLEYHVTRYFNTSGGYVVVSIGVGIVRIANENTLNCSSLEFTKSFLFVLDEALASEDAEVGDIWLIPGEELIRRLVVHRAEEEAVEDMNRGGNSFSPKVMGRLELIQHGSCHLNDRTVLPLHHAILLRGVRSGEFMLDPLFTYGIVLEFRPIVGPYGLDHFFKCTFRLLGKLGEELVGLILRLKEEHPYIS
jgi:hypothetical protein